MSDDYEARLAIGRANARITALQQRVAREVRRLNEEVARAAEGDGLDLPCILYGIKQVSIDPHGFLRLKRGAEERETLDTARLYAAIQGRFDWAVSELLAIAAELSAHDAWQSFNAAEQAAFQARCPDLAGQVAPDRLRRYFTHSYACGAFASAYPASLLRQFPTTARLYTAVRRRDGDDTDDSVVAMQLALIDLLMLPTEAGWQDLVERN